MSFETKGDTQFVRTLVPLEDFNRGLFSPSWLTYGLNLLHEVEYTSDASLLYPTVVRKHSDHTLVALGDIGKAKSEYWAFQHEWRYLMNIAPLDLFESQDTLGDRLAGIAAAMQAGTLLPACDHYDLRLSEEAMGKLEVVPSPKISAGNRVLLRTLLGSHDLMGSLQESELRGRL